MTDHPKNRGDRGGSGTARSRDGMRAGAIGVGVNVVLGGMKLLSGLLSGSVSAISDAVNNLGDAASSAVTLFGFAVSRKPADRKHPYGHARMEDVAGLVVSILIIFAGLEAARGAVEKILHPETITVSVFLLVVLGASCVVKVGLFLYYRMLWKKHRSLACRAAGTDSLNDTIVTGVLLAGTVISYLTGWHIDGWLGLMTGIYVIISGIRLVYEIGSALLGTAPPEGLESDVIRIIEETPSLLGYHDLHMHTYGSGHTHATVHMEFDSRMTLEQTHELLDATERRALDELEVELVSHVDPVSLDKRSRAYHKNLEADLKAAFPEASIHDLQVHWERPIRISYDLAVPYGYIMSDEKLLQAAERITKRKIPDCEVRITIDHV